MKPSNQRGRREGRELAAPMAPVRTKCTGQEPQDRPRHPGLPCANGLRLIRALPRDRRSCPCLRQCAFAHCADLSTGRPGPHDFPVRTAALVFCHRHVHRSPPLRIVTTRTPLFDEAGCKDIITSSEKKKEKYFSLKG